MSDLYRTSCAALTEYLDESRRFVSTDERNVEFYIRQFIPDHIDSLVNEPLETFAQRCIDDFPFDRIPTTPTLLELLNTLDQVLYMLDGIMSRSVRRHLIQKFAF